ncbi:MAG: FAD-binding oxidoreductase [Minwuiales bacterium]|nr:FAD-binding oxidoreductase [Minwuiales bacterium]
MGTAYVDSYYSRTVNRDRPRPALDGDVEADVCIVGGGMAGLATALGLAERGLKPVLLEAHRLGWGASGRNGGFVSPGFSLGEQSLVAKLGVEDARALYRLSADAHALIRSRIDRFGIDCGPIQDGVVIASWFDDSDAVRREVDFMRETFGTAHEFWPREKVRELYLTDRYHDAVFSPGSFHFHSLNFTLGIADAAEAAGAALYEGSPVIGHRLDGEPKIVRTDRGSVRADHVVFCCSGYIGSTHRRLALATLPVATYVMITEPLGNRLADAIRAPYAVADDRFAQDYYRPLPDGRILWGGRVSAFREPPARLAEVMRGDMLKVYPQLDGVAIDAAWDGLMGYARHKMPQIGRYRPGLWYCMGFGGRGMCATTMGGELIASAIAEGDERYKLFAPFGLRFAGGPLAPAAAQIAYWWYQTRDALRR